MKVSTIMLIIEGIKLLQAMQQNDKISTEVRNKLVAEALPDASEDEVAAISKSIHTIDPDFLSKLLGGVGEVIGKILK